MQIRVRIGADPDRREYLPTAVLKREHNPCWHWSATIADQTAARQLRRPADDRMLAGVARSLHADVTLVRVIIAALAADS